MKSSGLRLNMNMKGTKLRPKQICGSNKKDLLLFCTLPSSFKCLSVFRQRKKRKTLRKPVYVLILDGIRRNSLSLYKNLWLK